MTILSGNDLTNQTQKTFLFRLFVSRINRTGYLCLHALLTSFAFLGITFIAITSNLNAAWDDIIGIGAGIIILSVIIACVIIDVRRLHDCDMRGWWLLLYFIPGISFLLSLVLLFFPGTEIDNRFGPPPQKTKWIHYAALLLIPLSLYLLINSELLVNLAGSSNPSTSSEKID